MSNTEPSILIIDDETTVRENLAAFLDDEGFSTTQAGSALDALELIKSSNHYDLAIIDLKMPGMDGDELIFMAAKFDPNLKYLIHTGATEYNYDNRMAKYNINEDQILYKPVKDMKEFVSKITQILTSY